MSARIKVCQINGLSPFDLGSPSQEGRVLERHRNADAGGERLEDETHVLGQKVLAPALDGHGERVALEEDGDRRLELGQHCAALGAAGAVRIAVMLTARAFHRALRQIEGGVMRFSHQAFPPFRVLYR
jgi:hypothetical protein